VKRGDLVTVALKGDYGKPRPALVIQSDLFTAHPSVTILPMTSDLRPAPLFRIDIEPSRGNNLETLSQVMIDKIATIAANKLGKKFGRLNEANMLAINRALALWLGFV
jgi:mRNA interferase MazF